MSRGDGVDVLKVTPMLVRTGLGFLERAQVLGAARALVALTSGLHLVVAQVAVLGDKAVEVVVADAELVRGRDRREGLAELLLDGAQRVAALEHLMHALLEDEAGRRRLFGVKVAQMGDGSTRLRDGCPGVGSALPFCEEGRRIEDAPCSRACSSSSTLGRRSAMNSWRRTCSLSRRSRSSSSRCRRSYSSSSSR